MKINLSKREKNLLILLAVLLFIFAIYKFLFLPTTLAHNYAISEYNKYIAEENELKSNILSNESLKEKIENLKLENKELSLKLPPTLFQENIILTLVDNFEKNNIEIFTMIFGDEKRTSSKKANEPRSVDDALAIYEESMNINNEKIDSLSNIFNSNKTQDGQEDELEEEDPVKYFDVSLNCEGKYEDIKKLLEDFLTIKNIVITKNITLSKDSSSINNIIVSLELSFPYYPDNSNIDEQVWPDVDNKNNDIFPFDYYVPGSELDPNIISINSSNFINDYININTNLNKITNNETIKNDFYVILKPKASDNYAFTIGKSYDRPNSLHSDLNNENLQFVFNKTGNKYYYSLGTSLRPIDDSYIPAEFSPNSDKIRLNVQSQPRMGTDDKTFALLNIINKTDLSVEVTIEDDDPDYPRISVKAVEGDIVIKK